MNASLLTFFILLLIVCYTNGCACHPKIPNENNENNVLTPENNVSTSNGGNLVFLCFLASIVFHLVIG